MHEVDQVDQTTLLLTEKNRWECLPCNTPILLVTNEVYEQLSHCTWHIWEHSSEILVILIMESYDKLYGSIETKYIDVSTAILETTLGDAQYRLG